MKYSEWKALESRFTWDIHKKQEGKIDDKILDFDAPEFLSDGRYDLMFGDGDTFSILMMDGIEIKSGQFVPSVFTRDSIYTVVLCGDLTIIKNYNDRNFLKEALFDNLEVTGNLVHRRLMALDWNDKTESFDAFFGI